MSFKFEKLNVWHRSLDFANDIHLLTREWPKEELYILTSQIKRAADSVNLNIAEGSTGASAKHLSHFLGIAQRSLVEVVSCLYLAQKRNYLEASSFTKHYNEALEILKMIQSFRKRISK
ncbi:MAG: four helix bundle protein [Bacteroidia bacterium]|nr:four helix bundle protein [Bacteroidia bacterium]